LGTKAVEYIQKEQFGIMVAVKGNETQAVPLADVAGKVNYVPVDHPLIVSARKVGTSFGD
jgi:6-phosphofructokinase